MYLESGLGIWLPWCCCVVAKWMAALEKKLREAKQKSDLINVLFDLCEDVAMGSRGIKHLGGGRGCTVLASHMPSRCASKLI